MEGLNFIKNEGDEKDLSSEQTALVITIAEHLLVDKDVTLFETAHGHIVKIWKRPDTFIPERPARLDPEDLAFYAGLGEPLRWIEFGEDSITVGL